MSQKGVQKTSQHTEKATVKNVKGEQIDEGWVVNTHLRRSTV
jgi:hypothetical protein